MIMLQHSSSYLSYAVNTARNVGAVVKGSPSVLPLSVSYCCTMKHICLCLRIIQSSLVSPHYSYEQCTASAPYFILCQVVRYDSSGTISTVLYCCVSMLYDSATRRVSLTLIQHLVCTRNATHMDKLAFSNPRGVCNFLALRGISKIARIAPGGEYLKIYRKPLFLPRAGMVAFRSL